MRPMCAPWLASHLLLCARLLLLGRPGASHVQGLSQGRISSVRSGSYMPQIVP